MDLDKLYDAAHEIIEKDKLLNKYTFLAYNNIIEAKYLSVNDLINLDTRLSSYIAEHSKVLLFPSFIGDSINSLIVRPMLNKGTPLTLKSSNLPFNIGNISADFKYGDPLFIVEGIGDVGGIKLINPHINVISMNSSSLAKQHYEVIAALTHNVILIPDKDNAGSYNVNKMKREFKEFNINLKVLTQYEYLKDTGDIADLVLEYTKTKNENLRTKINIIKKYYTNMINVFI